MENSTATTETPTLVVRTRARHRPTDRDFKEFDSRTRVYFFETGETIINNLMNRRDRPYELYRECLPEVFEAAGWPRDRISRDELPKARWSQNAGCTCGCSPGFILDRRYTGPSGRPIDVYVDIS